MMWMRQEVRMWMRAGRDVDEAGSQYLDKAGSHVDEAGSQDVDEAGARM
jgi:hypothetical protein